MPRGYAAIRPAPGILTVIRTDVSEEFDDRGDPEVGPEWGDGG
jgi:hypothetical protein